MLFVPKLNEDIFKTYPELKQVEEFSALTDKQMRTVIWFADYTGPFRQKPKDDRMKLACLQAGYKPMQNKHVTLEFRAREIMGGELEVWNTALAKYMAMQHDEAREMIDMVDAQVDNIRTVIATPTSDEASLEKRNKLINSLPDLHETKRKLARMANMEETVMGISESDTKEGTERKMSLIDKVNEETKS